MNSTICPYPGLRPFNEEESIFFKGREQQVERLVKRLEEKKFLMVNGASGDGKSSLIYAGVIPFAKAGFFKAKYNNWIVADFRPERSPLKNLSLSLSRQLKIKDELTTEKELGYGFSALCDLYKSSDYYIDESKSNWINADEKERKSLKRKGANLLVLVDQFEEFFTNPENYQNGIPSIESQKTVNLLLETYKLAATQDLPIYVVCTMRSDYIGQCAAFRGLPEAIGYSQFFVPRLKRQEIEQVIEGPAELAGCKISKRLTQTLLNSLTDGFDQLPILQHALNQIWKAAQNGTEEMDLIHLAMVGGLSSKILSSDDKVNFANWTQSLPAYKVLLLENPSLSNILNAHANELFLTAHLHYKNNFGDEITQEQAQRIIKVVFQCLTKMDASRAVRNRMTLQEITNILHDEEITTKKVDRVLRVYREQGNTFLQPFIEEQGENKELMPSSVLDITHESLIRNWLQLTIWANEEYENLQNYLDFNKQLQRWINSNYSSGYLLPIGPLSFFENWYDRLEPSKYWINRYEKFEGIESDNLIKAAERIDNAEKFIEKSGKKLFVSKTVLKYGANKIITVFGLLAMLVAITYYYLDYREKQNSFVVNEVTSKGIALIKKTNIQGLNVAGFLIANDRLRESQNLIPIFDKLLDEMENDSLEIEYAVDMIQALNQMNENDTLTYNPSGHYSTQVFTYLIEKYLENVRSNCLDFEKEKFKIINVDQVNRVLGACMLMKFYHPEKAQVGVEITKTIDLLKKMLSLTIKHGAYQACGLKNDNLVQIFMSLLALDDKPNYREILSLISPYENNNLTSSKLVELFEGKEEVYFNNNKQPLGGYYELLAMLYASEFDVNPNAVKYLETLINTSTKLNFGIYVTRNINDILLKNCKNPIEAIKIINKYAFDFFAESYFKEKFKDYFRDISKFGLAFLPNLSKIDFFIPDQNRTQLINETEKELQIKNTTHDKLELANFYKFCGFYYYRIEKNKTLSTKYFDKAFQTFEKINIQERESEYLNNKNTKDIWSSGSFRFLFALPISSYSYIGRDGDYFAVDINTKFVSIFDASIFLSYIINTNKVAAFNTNYGIETLRGQNNLNEKLSYLFDTILVHLFQQKMTDEKKQVLKSQLNTQYQFAQTNLMHTKAGLANQIREKLLPCISSTENQKISNDEFDTERLSRIITRLIQQREITLCDSLIDKIPTGQKTETLLKICLLVNETEYKEYLFYFINRMTEEQIKEKINWGPEYFKLLGKIGGNAVEYTAQYQISEYKESAKPFVVGKYFYGLIESGNYYKAIKSSPEYFSISNILDTYGAILEMEAMHLKGKSKSNQVDKNWNDSPFYIEDLNLKKYLGSKAQL